MTWWSREKARRWPPTAMRARRAFPRRGAGGGAARRRIDSVSPEAHARRQQSAHLPAAGAQGGHHAEVRLAASEVRGRAGAARSADQRRRIQRALVGAGDQPQLRPELVRQPGARRAAGGNGIRAERRGRDVLRARGRLSAQLPRGALRRAAHRDHLPDVLPLGAPERHRHPRHAVPDGGPGAGAVLSTAAGAVRAPELRPGLRHVGRRAGGADHHLPDRRAQARRRWRSARARASRRCTRCSTGSCAPRTTRCSWVRCCCSACSRSS